MYTKVRDNLIAAICKVNITQEIPRYNLGFKTFGMLEQCNSGDLVYYKEHEKKLVEERVRSMKTIHELRDKNTALLLENHIYKTSTVIFSISTFLLALLHL